MIYGGSKQIRALRLGIEVILRLEDWKIEIAILWIIGDLAAVVGLMLSSIDALSQASAEVGGIPVTPELLLVFAVMFLIPLVMAFLSLMLKDQANRWTNMIMGIVYFAFGIMQLSMHLSAPYYLLTGIAGVAASALLVWYAWTSKQKA